MYEPGECLIMDRNGRIHLHSDIDDEMAYRHAKFTSPSNLAAIDRKPEKEEDDDDGGRGNDRGGD